MSEITVDTTAAERKKIINRLKRAQGQLNSLVTAVENDANCKQVITQLAAVSKALDRAGFAIISSSMKDCLADPAVVDDPEKPTPEELEKLFMMLA